PGFTNLMANAELALDGSLGHVTEVLSGDYYQPLSTSSPQQIWSAAMVISPLLRGLFGLQTDAGARRVTLAPHVPANWSGFTLDHVRVGQCALRLAYQRSANEISLVVTRNGSGDCSLEFSPALSLRAQILGAEVNGRKVPFQVNKSDVDQHVGVKFPVASGETRLRLRIRDDFGLSISPVLPALGSASQGLRVLSESWAPARDTLTLEVSGAQGRQYEIGVRNAAQVASVEGAELVKIDADSARMNLTIPASTSELNPHEKIVIHFISKAH
ncbi:MAG TPA: hypothetical protein VK198_05165, partial [Terriglobales bacterium]|nr:hypothetical protein [Terriglobales bacterium]